MISEAEREKISKALNSEVLKSLLKMYYIREKTIVSTVYHKCVICRKRYNTKILKNPSWYVNRNAKLCPECYHRSKIKNLIKKDSDDKK